MEKKKLGKNIVPAGAGKSTLGYLIDLGLTIAMMVLLYFTVGQVIQKKLGIDQKNQALVDLYDSSYIVAKQDDGQYAMKFYNTGTPGNYGYEKYGQDVWNYYTVFVVKDGTFLASDNFKGIKSNPYDVGEWVYDHVYGLTETSPVSTFFQIPKDEFGDYDFTARPILSDQAQRGITGASAEVWAKDLREFYCSSDDKDKMSNITGAMFDCVKHLVQQPKYIQINSDINTIRYLMMIPSYAASPFIFFFLIPVFVPNGRSIGKLAAGTAVLGKDGYKARKINIILHYAILTLMFELLLLPYTLIAIMGIMLLLLVDYMVLVMSKVRHQSLHDMLAGTIVVNAKQSIWFIDAEAEEEYCRAHPNSNIARIKRDEKEETVKTTKDGRVLYAAQSYLYDDSVLDASKIGSARREAETLTNFDEYEARKSEEMDEHKRIHDELRVTVDEVNATATEEEKEAETPAEEKEPEIEENRSKKPMNLKIEGEENEVANEHEEENDGFVDNE
ncbi:MAG: RDD family protein [Bacilli bacterium]|nr:RDD family protein [Bacilli bacterium]MDY6431076.1 RDD family protein [Bacilli bacterium]